MCTGKTWSTKSKNQETIGIGIFTSISFLVWVEATRMMMPITRERKMVIISLVFCHLFIVMGCHLSAAKVVMNSSEHDNEDDGSRMDFQAPDLNLGLESAADYSTLALIMNAANLSFYSLPLSLTFFAPDNDALQVVSCALIFSQFFSEKKFFHHWNQILQTPCILQHLQLLFWFFCVAVCVFFPFAARDRWSSSSLHVLDQNFIATLIDSQFDF